MGSKGRQRSKGVKGAPKSLQMVIAAIKLNIYFCFIDYAKAFDCVDHDKLWEILQEM